MILNALFEDGATVPLYYENRGAKLDDLQNPEITDEILDAIRRQIWIVHNKRS